MNNFLHEIRTLIRMGIKSFIPTRKMYDLRALRNKRARNRLAKQTSTEHKYTAAELREQLRHSGIDPTRDIFVHSAFSKIQTDCSAEEIVDMLIDYMDPEANIIMPAFPMAGTMIEWMTDTRAFDADNSPSMMGAITEVFRCRPDTLRSLHPTHSVSVRGPGAEWYIRDHHTDLMPAGAVSPFYRFYERSGQSVNIGTSVRNITANHMTHDTFEALPFNVFLPEPMSKTVIYGGQEIVVSSMVANPLLSPWRIDNFPPKLKDFRRVYEEAGILRTFQFGAAEVVLMDIRDLIDLQRKLAKDDITIYHRPVNPIVRKIAGYPF